MSLFRKMFGYPKRSTSIKPEESDDYLKSIEEEAYRKEKQRQKTAKALRDLDEAEERGRRRAQPFTAKLGSALQKLETGRQNIARGAKKISKYAREHPMNVGHITGNVGSGGMRMNVNTGLGNIGRPSMNMGMGNLKAMNPADVMNVGRGMGLNNKYKKRR